MRWFWEKRPLHEELDATKFLASSTAQVDSKYVECRECGHIISKCSAKSVEWRNSVFYPGLHIGPRSENLTYCKNCLPPYGRIEWLEKGARYYAWVEVDENGKPIDITAKVKK